MRRLRTSSTARLRGVTRTHRAADQAIDDGGTTSGGATTQLLVTVPLSDVLTVDCHHTRATPHRARRATAAGDRQGTPLALLAAVPQTHIFQKNYCR